MSNWRRHRAFIGEKVPENGPFRDQFSRGVGIRNGPFSGTFSPSGPAQGQITHTNHTPMNYKYSLVGACQGMASPLQPKLSPQDQLRDRVGCAYLIYTAQGVRAAGLQLALSCATGLGVPTWYTLNQGETRSWSAAGSPNLWQLRLQWRRIWNLRLHQLDNICSSHS